MSTPNDIKNELAAAVEAALEALMNVPVVGEIYDQQHSDTHMKAYLRLQAAKEHSDAL